MPKSGYYYHNKKKGIGQCHGYKCNCTGEHDITRNTCACGHFVPHQGGNSEHSVNTESEITTETDGGRSQKKARRTESMPRNVVEPRGRAKGRSDLSQPARHTLTSAEARAKLRAAGIPVGKRGRLSPEQMAQAAKL